MKLSTLVKKAKRLNQSFYDTLSGIRNDDSLESSLEEVRTIANEIDLVFDQMVPFVEAMTIDEAVSFFKKELTFPLLVDQSLFSLRKDRALSDLMMKANVLHKNLQG